MRGIRLLLTILIYSPNEKELDDYMIDSVSTVLPAYGSVLDINTQSCCYLVQNEYAWSHSYNQCFPPSSVEGAN